MKLRDLYYITHIENLESILKHGILSHASAEKLLLIKEEKAVFDKDIVLRRKDKLIQYYNNKVSLWYFANLYFNPRNPMLYRLLNSGNGKKLKNKLIILNISSSILKEKGIVVTDGNAASNGTRFYMLQLIPEKERKRVIAEIRKQVNMDSWIGNEDNKRKIMAECLVPDAVESEHIQAIYVPNINVMKKVENIVNRLKTSGIIKKHIQVIPEPYFFFLPNFEKKITDNVKIIEGDMIYTEMRTLTITVNTVCVMGGGIAKRARELFPDVYEKYIEVCKSKKLSVGKPYLYKRQKRIKEELLSETRNQIFHNNGNYILLFPTKAHWRFPSKIEWIEKGLEYLVKNYGNSMESLAIPALGCGLGGLEWGEVGPIMVKYLSKLDIPVEIYLPLNREIPQVQKERKFLTKFLESI